MQLLFLLGAPVTRPAFEPSNVRTSTSPIFVWKRQSSVWCNIIKSRKKMLKTRCSAKTLNSFHKSKYSVEQYFFNPDPCESSKRLQNQDGYVLFWFQSPRLASIVPTMLMKSMFRLHISGKADLHRLRRFFLRFIDRFK